MPYKDPAVRRARQKTYQSRNLSIWKSSNSKYRQSEKGRNWMWRYKGIPVPAHPEPKFCESCGSPPRGRSKTRLVPDHDHTTGKARGWLCSICNPALGAIGDNIAAVEKLLAYLKKYS